MLPDSGQAWYVLQLNTAPHNGVSSLSKRGEKGRRFFIMKTSSQEGTAKQPASKGRQGMKHMSGGKPPCIWLPAKSLETF